LGLVTFDGFGGVTGGGFSYSHTDNLTHTNGSNPSAEPINCSLAITDGSYAVNGNGAGTVMINLAIDVGFPGGAPFCNSLSDGASFTFAFVLNNSGVLATSFATSAAVQLINFHPIPFHIDITTPSTLGESINGMTMTGSLRLQGSASE
jgi:hypothetical protein